MVTAKIPKVDRNLEQKKKTAQSNKYNLNQPIHTEANPEINPLTIRSHPVLYENISIYSHAVMTKGQPDDITLCHNETFCCHANYSMTDILPTISYHLLAYKGERSLVDTYMLDIELCGLVLCEGDICGKEPVRGQEKEVFQYLQLSATYSTSLVIPSVLEWSGMLPDWNKIQFQATDKDEGVEVILSLEETALYSGAVYGRVVG